jgi:hypothetical protein
MDIFPTFDIPDQIKTIVKHMNINLSNLFYSITNNIILFINNIKNNDKSVNNIKIELIKKQ